MPSANTHAMQAHLGEISQAVAPGAHAVVLMDRAGWHTTRSLEMPHNITPILLPPRAPELNPAENVWQYLRQNYLSNRVFADYYHRSLRMTDGRSRATQAILASLRARGRAGPRVHESSSRTLGIRRHHRGRLRGLEPPH